MTTSRKIQAVGAILAITVLTVAAQGVKEKLATEVVAEKRTVRLGDPILVSVRVTNQAARVTEADRSATAFDCFEVTGPDGQRLRYAGFDGQVTGLSDSRAIAIEVTPGQLSEFDEVAASLLPVCPNGWRLAKDARGDVTPFGRSRVAGFALHLCHNHMRGEAVLLWFTKAESKLDPSQPSRAESQYFGRVRGFFGYGSVGSNTPALWAAATEDISRALQLKKE